MPNPRHPKSKNGQNLGKSLIRKQQNARRGRHATSNRHTTLDHEGTSISITENTSIDEFITNAEAAQRSFEAERVSHILHHSDDVIAEEIDSDNGHGDDDDDDDDEENKFCSVPKKPNYVGFESADAEEYQRLEALEFLKWKRNLNKMQRKHPKLPLFEKNIDFWRQLWKIVEISDVVVQVLDARDPLFYYSKDLANYVEEVGDRSGSKKCNVLILNKADFLTESQRNSWSNYFRESDMLTLFFSATIEDHTDDDDDDHLEFNTSVIYSPEKVLEVIQTLNPRDGPITMGFLGYPNVGKSSTINRFLTSGKKRLQVSTTPGKTKHYQTHVLNSGAVVLVDGPGLVIPSFQMGKAEMVLAGILPIDNLTEYFTSIELMLTKISFETIRKHYGIMASCVIEAKKTTDRKSSDALQLLSAFGIMRGFMKPGGVPDHARAARVILKDYVQGKLKYCQAPPNENQLDYDPRRKEEDQEEDLNLKLALEDAADLSIRESFPEISRNFGIHVRGRISVGGPQSVKGSKKDHGNKKKREKTRRVFKDSTY